MKKKSLLLILLMVLLAPWAAKAQTTLLEENFDAMSSIATSYSATDWYAYNAGSGNNWTLQSSGGVGSSKCARYKWNSSYAANCYLVSAPFNVNANMEELGVSLYEKVESSNLPETFEVFFVKSSDVTDNASITSATKYMAIASASYTNTSYAEQPGSNDNSALAGQSVRLVVHCTSIKDQYYLYIDDITVTETIASSCSKPDTFEHSNVTANSATLTWSGGSGTYNVEYKKASDADWTVALTNTTLLTTNLTLEPATNYEARVQSVCTGENSGWKTTNFNTDCGVISTFPKSYGFETSEGFPTTGNTPTTNQLGVCWRNEATVQSGSYATRLWGTSTSYKKYGSQSLILPDKGNGSKTMLVFPEMNFTSPNGYVVSFWIYRDYSGTDPEGFKVYISDTDTISTNAVMLGHYSRGYSIAYPVVESASGWYQYEISIPHSTMTGNVYLIFEGISYYHSATYVDDVKIEVAPTCKKPSGLAKDATAAHTATLHWTNGEATQDAWQIAYSTSSSFAPADNFTPGEGEGLVNVTTNPATIEGLTQSTTYYAYVRANCGGGDYSPWSNAKVSFSTISGKQKPTNLAVLNPTITSDQARVVWKGVATNELHTNYEVYYSRLSTKPDPLEADSLIVVSGAVDTTYLFTNLDAEKKYFVWVRDNCGADGYSDWTSSINFTTASNCQTPDGLTFSNISSSSLTVDWADHGTVSNWNVRYSSDSGTTWTTIENATKPCPIDGLTGNTEYRVQVQAQCNTEAWSAYATCRTAYSVPFTEEFSTTYTPTNWENKTGLLDNVMTGTALTTGSKWSFGTHSNLFNSHARINIYGGIAESNASYGWLITPNITVGDNYSLSFDLALTNYDTPTGMTQPVTPQTTGTDDKFIVLVSTDNEANWTVLRQWDNAGSAYVYNNIAYNGETVYIDLAAYNNQTVRIAFYGESTVKNADNNLHIDNVEVNITSDCHKPTNVASSNVTNHSATITWVAGTVGQELWQLKYNKDADFDPNTEGESDVVEVNPTYTFNKTLDAASVYYVYVRGNCGTTSEPDYGPWSKKCTFNTVAASPAPTTFAKTEVGPDWVDLYWNAPAGDYLSGYGIYYSTNSTAPEAETTATVTINDPTAPTSAAPYRLTGLTSETTYYIWVRANHETDVYSAWKAITGSSITTLVACPAPTALAANNITHTTADLSWTGYSDSYTIQKRTAASAGTNLLSESFDGDDLPTGWSITGLGTSNWSIEESNNAGGEENELYLNWNPSFNGTSRVVLPEFDLTGITSISVSFKHSFDWYSGSSTIGIATSSDNGTTWNSGWSKSYSADASGTIDEIITTSDMNNEHVLICLYYTGNTYGIDAWYFDDIQIGTVQPAGEWADVATNVTETPYPLTDLTAGTKYDVRVKGNCGGEYSDVKTFTTIDNNTKIFKTAGDWNVAGNWEGGIPENMTQNAIIRANVTIPNGCVATANNITFEGTPTPTITMMDGGQLMHNNTGVTLTVHKSITGYGDGDGKWYLLSAPSSPDVDPDDVENMITGDYDLFAFDYTEVGAEWQNYKQHGFDLISGDGYLYANKENKDLVFTNEIDPIGGISYYVGITNTNEGTQPLNGFHLVGNFYPCNTYLTIDNVASAFYKMNNDHDEIVTAAIGTPIAPGEGVFVLATSSTEQQVRFVKELPVTSFNNGNLIVNVSNNATRGNIIDNAIVYFGEGTSLDKFQMNPNHTKLYIPQEGKDYAVVSAEAKGEMPLNFKAETIGNYTISISTEDINFSYLRLIDNFTGENVDLLVDPEYTFIGSPRDNENRFRIVFSSTGSDIAMDDIFAYQNGSDIVVNGEGELQVFDVMGRLIATQHINGVQTVNVNANGVYIFKLNEKTQKIVVR